MRHFAKRLSHEVVGLAIYDMAARSTADLIATDIAVLETTCRWTISAKVNPSLVILLEAVLKCTLQFSPREPGHQAQLPPINNK
jgi:hypothetical protein